MNIDKLLQDSKFAEKMIEELVRRKDLSAYMRNPLLGKMIKCPACGRRRRKNGPPCCNPRMVKELK